MYYGKVFVVGNSEVVAIPAAIRRHLDLVRGDDVTIEVGASQEIIIKQINNSVGLRARRLAAPNGPKNI